jgi:N-acyl-D-amino-acid deacylase
MLWGDMPRSLTTLLAAALCAGSPALFAADPPFDLVVGGGRIVDGTGAPSYRGDVGVRAGRIAAIGKLDGAAADRRVDAAGLVVAPGFIDLMGQTALPLLEDPAAALNLLTQGITTINAGEGDSDAPLDGEAARARGWRTMAEYLQLLDLKGMPVNVVQTVGHTQVRRLVLGEGDRRPSAAELERMQDLVREAMEAGAIGVSTALIYPPAVYADTAEIASLAAVAGRHGGGYFTHLRNEGDRLLEAIDEAIDIARTAGTPLHIFHLKTAGRANWPKMELAIARLKAARAEGLDATADIYPYIHNGLGIESFIHPRHFAAGREPLLERLDDAALRMEIRSEMESGAGWENWYRHVGQDWDKVIVGRTSHERYRDLVGQSLAALATARGEDPWDVFFQLVRAGAFALPESMSEANKIRALGEGLVAFCTDVGPAGGSEIASHPRGYGAFPRLLGRYVRELGAISLERAVAQAGAAAANQVFAYDRGRIAIGQAADIIVFDAERITDRATFAAPHQVAEGMRHVIVGGVPVLENGKETRARPGRVLRGPGHRRAPVSGDDEPRTLGIDRAVLAFLETHRIPGAAVAITAHGRLVYARGFGHADLATREPVTATSLFRIASISKPITAAAVLQLVDDGRLKLEDKVFDILPLEPHLEAGAAVDARQKEVTIRHLLEHRGGWDRAASFDPMFQATRFAELLGVPPPAGPAEVIRAMSGLALDFAPGERYAYSNSGYCLLGRVIEKLTGQSYEESVRERLLKPRGIARMRIGRTRLELRAEGEVRYYEPDWGPSCFAADLGQRVPQPYGPWHLEAMDAHGGWIASAVDLARFACAFDDPESSKVLKAESVRAMSARPPGLAGHNGEGRPRSQYYGLGWQVEARDDGGLRLSHGGSLPGTSTLLVRRHDGRNVVILINTRASPRGVRLDTALEAAVAAACDEVKEWPAEDLFERYP